MPKKNEKQELAEYQAEETFHRREWLVQRIGWVLLTLLLLAALTGALGHGPLARQTLVVGESIVEIDRIMRREAASEWTIRPKAQSHEHDLEVRLGAGLLEYIRIEWIVPEPREQKLEQDGVVFVFDAAATGTPIVFHVEPFDFGFTRGEIQVGTAQPVFVKQLIYP